MTPNQFKLFKAKDYLNLTNKMQEQLAKNYQTAFSKQPWNEVTKCASKNLQARCIGGFSPQKIGESCQKCQQSLINPAYSTKELLQNFNQKALEQNAIFYTESDQNEEVIMCAILWLSTPDDLFNRKYRENPEMKLWLSQNLDSEFIYLDEIFADLNKRPTGNLWNIKSIIDESSTELGSQTIVYRTIQDMLNYKILKTFDSKFKLFNRNIDLPDRRDIGLINLNN